MGGYEQVKMSHMAAKSSVSGLHVTHRRLWKKEDGTSSQTHSGSVEDGKG